MGLRVRFSGYGVNVKKFNAVELNYSSAVCLKQKEITGGRKNDYKVI